MAVKDITLVNKTEVKDITLVDKTEVKDITLVDKTVVKDITLGTKMVARDITQEEVPILQTLGCQGAMGEVSPLHMPRSNQADLATLSLWSLAAAFRIPTLDDLVISRTLDFQGQPLPGQ